jgi:hypothetical protein
MGWKPSIAAAIVVLTVGATGFGPQAVTVAQAACGPGEKIDGSTAVQAKKKIEAAGFRQVSDLRKGCDNFWHGRAMKGNAPVNVGLSPQGRVYTEGD